jgi:hypothetical protein
VREGFSAKDLLLGRPEDFLTSPPGRRYNSGIIRRGDLLHGAAIHRAGEKANSYISIGVPTLSYLPWAIMNYASVAILILFGATGFTMAGRKREDETQAGS